MTQDDVAVAMQRGGIGWRRATVTAIEGGTRAVAIDEIVMLSQIFGRTLEWWIEEEGHSGRMAVKKSQQVLREVSELLAATSEVTITETDTRVARRLFVKPIDLAKSAYQRWGHSLLEERELRLSDRLAGVGEISESRVKALRGRITRELIVEMSSPGMGIG